MELLYKQKAATLFIDGTSVRAEERCDFKEKSTSITISAA